MVVPENRRLQLNNEISNYVYGKFFRCIRPFLSWLKKGETYWFEYKDNNMFEVRSDNNLGKTFNMEIHQLLTCFLPCECEDNEFEMIRYFHWLGELNIHHGYVDDYIQYKEQLYLKMAMLDCTTCSNYKKECEPEKNIFKCNYPLKTNVSEEKQI